MELSVESLKALLGVNNPSKEQIDHMNRVLVVIKHKISVKDLIIGNVASIAFARSDCKSDEAISEAIGETLKDIAENVGELIGATSNNPLESARLFARVFTQTALTTMRFINREEELEKFTKALEQGAMEAEVIH